MTQTQKILQYLKDHGSINPGEAYTNLHIYRLGARILELRREGHNIETKMEKTRNADGETVRYAVYSMEKGARNHE